MKIIRYFFVSIVLTMIAGTVNAQMFVSGSINLSTSMPKTTTGSVTTDGWRNTYFRIAPAVGYFLNDKLAVGAGVSYSLQKQKQNDVANLTSMFGITPFVRYYAVSLGDVNIFAQGNVGIEFGANKTKNDGNTTDGPKYLNFGVSVTPAISYSLGEKLAVEAFLGSVYYSFNREKREIGGTTTTIKTNGLGLNFDMTSVSLGVIYKF
jgi:hypothetical protein